VSTARQPAVRLAGRCSTRRNLRLDGCLRSTYHPQPKALHSQLAPAVHH